MGSDTKFDPDDDDMDDGAHTVTRKIRKLQKMGVLDTPPGDPGSFGMTTTITTYPYEKTKSEGGRFSRLFDWLKKD